MKQVSIYTDYVTLGQVLKMLNFVQTGGETKVFLLTHEVKVNGECENRRGRKLFPATTLSIDEDEFTITKK